MNRIGLTAGVIAICLVICAPSRMWGQTAGPATLADSGFADAHQADITPTLHLLVGRSLVLKTKNPLKRIYVGNPVVLQSYNSGPEEVVLTAKAYGVSSLVLWEMNGQSHMYTVLAEVDADAARGAFGAAFPDNPIGLEGREGRLFLTGEVPTDAISDAAMKLAGSYSKDVINGLRVVPVHGKQVQLKLKIVEVDRSKLDQFGINFFAGGRTPLNTSTQQFNTTVSNSGSGSSIQVSDPLNIFLYNYKLGVGVTLKDLESKQILQILAEPTLTTLSGISAKFLAGGEFPVPIVQGGTGNSTAITITYKPFGVKVDFTPTVNRDGTIRLKVAPEVSTLDYTNSVTISGTTVPALSTRRAETEVEIRSGETFMVSGILDHRTTDSLSNVPGISNIPFIGQLFRSKGLNRSVVELVVLVTATVVDPLTPGGPSLGPAAEPAMSVPNMSSKDFDKVFLPLVKEHTTAPKKVEDSSASTPASKP